LTSFAIILAAGKQTRFDSNIPKCLYPYKKDTTKTILEKNIEIAHAWGCHVVVVLNSETDNSNIIKILKLHNNINITIVDIISGKGTGHAVYEAIKHLYINDDDKCFLMWGDSIQDNIDLYRLTDNAYNNIMTVPLKREDKCYMKFVVDPHTSLITGAYHPSGIESGYHDYSFFLFNIKHIFNLLSIYVSKSTSTIFNNIYPEIDFIQLFNFYPNTFNSIFPEYSSINAFNTIKEYEEL